MKSLTLFAPSNINKRLDELRPNRRNPRIHSARQIRAIANSIRQFGFTAPILIDEEGRVLAGHGRLEAARLLGLETVPTLCIAGLGEAKKLAYAIADNRITELAGWDRTLLAAELATIIEFDADYDLSVTGFATAEIDLLIQGADDDGTPDADDTVALPDGTERAVTRDGDLWYLGDHRLLCGDATDASALERLMSGETARMVITDPPYNVPIDGHVSGKGKARHREFAMASGEMTPEAFEAFLVAVLRATAARCSPGALIYSFMDWRHLVELLGAARDTGLGYINLCVWSKTNGGMGSLYRSAHELILAFKVGCGPHVNNVALGRYGRNRTNVWTYPGVNTFRRGRLEDLAAHPTVKPVGLVADAIQDATHRGDIVLDPFLGSGTTILAAERMGRRCRAIEIDPLYVDVAIRRWQESTGKFAIHEETGLTFDALAAERENAEAAAGQSRGSRHASGIGPAPAKADGSPALRKQAKPVIAAQPGRRSVRTQGSRP